MGPQFYQVGGICGEKGGDLFQEDCSFYVKNKEKSSLKYLLGLGSKMTKKCINKNVFL